VPIQNTKVGVACVNFEHTFLTGCYHATPYYTRSFLFKCQRECSTKAIHRCSTHLSFICKPLQKRLLTFICRFSSAMKNLDLRTQNLSLSIEPTVYLPDDGSDIIWTGKGALPPCRTSPVLRANTILELPLTHSN
jgi:hypothetical protein